MNSGNGGEGRSYDDSDKGRPGGPGGGSAGALRLFICRPTEVSYVSTNGFAVLAHSQAEARAVATAADYSKRDLVDPDAASCEEIALVGKPRVVFTDDPTG